MRDATSDVPMLRADSIARGMVKANELMAFRGDPPVRQYRNDAAHVIAGAEITMCRYEADDTVKRYLGADVGRVSIVDHWREQVDGSALCLTVIHHPLMGGEYAVLVWGLDEMIAGALQQCNLHPSLALIVYAVGALNNDRIRHIEDARSCGLELARLVAHAELPWPPEDERDHARWETATALIDVRARPV